MTRKYLKFNFRSLSFLAILTATLTACFLFPASSQAVPLTGGTGPGGMGTTDGTSTLRLWFQADQGAYSDTAGTNAAFDGGGVGNWNNLSGYTSGPNNFNAIADVAGREPVYMANAVNGHAVLDFSGGGINTGSRLNLTGPAAFPMSGNETGFFALNFDQGAHRGILSGNDGPNRAYAGGSSSMFESSGFTFANNYRVNGVDNPATGAAPAFHVVTGLDNPTPASSVQLRFGSGHGGNPDYGGQLAESFVFNEELNSAKVQILENYLSSRYGTVLNAGDIYVGDTVGNGNYDEQVFGVGRVDAGNIHTSGGSGGLGIEVTGGLGDGEFIMAGNDATDNAFSTLDLTGTGANQRWARSWFMDVTDVGGLSADLVFGFDTTGLGTTTGLSSFKLLHRDVNSGNYIDTGLVASGVTGTEVTFNFAGLTGLDDGYYTLGFSRPAANSNGGGFWDVGATWDSALEPTASDLASILNGDAVTVRFTGEVASALDITDGSLIVNDASDLTIGNNLFVDPTLGSLSIGGGTSGTVTAKTGTIQGNNITVNNGGVLNITEKTTVSAATTLQGTGTYQLGGVLDVNAALGTGTATLDVSGTTVNINDNLTVNAGGTLTSPGANFNVNAGVFDVGGAALSAGGIVTSGSASVTNATSITAGGVALSGSSSITTSGLLTASGITANGGTLTANGISSSGTVNVNGGTVTATGGSNVSAATLNLNSGAFNRTGNVTVTNGLNLVGLDLNVSGGAVLTTNGANVLIGSGRTLTTDNALNVNGIDITGNLVRSGASVANRAVNVANNGFFYLSGQDIDFTGETFTLGTNTGLRITNGRTLTVPDSTFIANSGADPNTLQINNLWVQNATLNTTGIKSITVASEIRLDNVAMPHNLTGRAILSVGSASNNTGLVELSGTNTYTNQNQIRRGTLRIASPASLGNGLVYFLSSQAAPVNNNTGALLSILEGNGTFARTTGASAGQVYWGNNGGFGAYGGNFTVTLDGGATLNWGDNPKGFVTNRQLQLNGPHSNSTVIFTNDINVNPSGNIGEIHTTQGVGAAKAVMSGSFSAPDAARTLRFTGTGILELTGNTNAFAGAVVINGSTVRVLGDFNTTASQTITIGSNAGIGGRLEHGGNSGGNVIVNNLGQIAPGNSPGTFTVDGNFTINSGGIYDFELGKQYDINSGVDDLIDVNGIATLNNGWILRLTDAGGANPDGDLIKIMDFTTLGTLGLVNIDASDLLLNPRYSLGDLQVMQIGNSLFLSGITSQSLVPEPSSATLLLLGVVALPYLRRRRRA